MFEAVDFPDCGIKIGSTLQLHKDVKQDLIEAFPDSFMLTRRHTRFTLINLPIHC